MIRSLVSGWSAIGTSGIFVGHELVDAETLRKSEIYTDYCRRLGAFHFLGAALDVGERYTVVLVPESGARRADRPGQRIQRAPPFLRAQASAASREAKNGLSVRSFHSSST